MKRNNCPDCVSTEKLPLLDIVLCKDLTTNEFIAPRFSKKYTLTDVKYPDLKENLKWYALIVLSYNHTIREQPTPLGAMKMKARQLKVLGFVPIFVSARACLQKEMMTRRLFSGCMV